MTFIRTMHKNEWGMVATLIHQSTNRWYETHYGHPLFTCTMTELDTLFCGTYEALDPDCCIVFLSPATDARFFGHNKRKLSQSIFFC